MNKCIISGRQIIAFDLPGDKNGPLYPHATDHRSVDTNNISSIVENPRQSGPGPAEFTEQVERTVTMNGSQNVSDIGKDKNK